jgi:hypothetical protein
LKKYNIVYKTTNIVNNKIYVGLHSTDCLEDGYLGSGWVLKDAIEKYGRDKFVRQILYVFDTRQEAMEMEARIVNEEFVSRKDTYNLTVGGMGVIDQRGPKNPMYGKVAPNAKALRAEHIDGRSFETSSIKELQSLINIDRANIRNLIRKGIRGRRGWRVTLM